MKLTNKQKYEIDFFAHVWANPAFDPTGKEIEGYIANTVHGKQPETRRSFNRLIQVKRRADITIKMWKEDLVGTRDGLPILYPIDLIEDPMYQHSYGKKVIDSVIGAS